MDTLGRSDYRYPDFLLYVILYDKMPFGTSTKYAVSLFSSVPINWFHIKKFTKNI